MVAGVGDGDDGDSETKAAAAAAAGFWRRRVGAVARGAGAGSVVCGGLVEVIPHWPTRKAHHNMYVYIYSSTCFFFGSVILNNKRQLVSYSLLTI